MKSAPDDISQAFHSFLAVGELRFLRCPACSCVLAYADRRCPCGTGVPAVWKLASGVATLHSFVVYHRDYGAGFEPPYNVAQVELVEGPRLISTIRSDSQHLVVDMPLRSAFDARGRLVFDPA